MCGRYGLKSDKQDIATAFYAKKVNPNSLLALLPVSTVLCGIAQYLPQRSERPQDRSPV